MKPSYTVFEIFFTEYVIIANRVQLPGQQTVTKLLMQTSMVRSTFLKKFTFPDLIVAGRMLEEWQ